MNFEKTIIAEMDAITEATTTDVEVFCERILAVDIMEGGYKDIYPSLRRLADQAGVDPETSDSYSEVFKAVLVDTTMTMLIEDDGT